MIFFLDESGHPHPNDPTLRPVLLAIGFPIGRSRELARTLYSIKNRFGFKDPWAESKLKANRLLNERTFRSQPDKWEYVEAVFDLCNSFPFVTFAMVMEKPTAPQRVEGGWILPQHMFLLQRMHWHVVAKFPDRYALVVFDSRDPKGDMELSMQLSGFLHRSNYGMSLDRVVDSALFVDSRITPGIQIADLFASCVRQFHEVCRDQARSAGAAYVSAPHRLYRTLKRTFHDVEDGSGASLYAEYFLSAERLASWRTGGAEGGMGASSERQDVDPCG
jgi:hypothetical protein